jgi:hypothetical protein
MGVCPLWVCLALAVLALMLLVLAGCGGSSTVTPPPTSLEISRTVPANLQGPPTYFLPFDKTFSDAAVVHAFYTQTLALSHLPTARSEPDNGCNPQPAPYQLTFRHEATTVLAGTLTLGSCGVLDITTKQGRPAHEVRLDEAAYEGVLAPVLGLTEMGQNAPGLEPGAEWPLYVCVLHFKRTRCTFTN